MHTHGSFFLTATPPAEIYTLSLHDALPIYDRQDRRDRYLCAAADRASVADGRRPPRLAGRGADRQDHATCERSEEHTSELQSRRELVCRLLLEKKKYRKLMKLHNAFRA